MKRNKLSLLGKVSRYVSFAVAISIVIYSFGCSASESGNITLAAQKDANAEAVNTAANSSRGATIDIDPNGPADTVRVFYKLLREKKIREAIFLTNLRPAIEGLTDDELKEFALDFEAIAVEVPEEIQINGEIISGDSATVTANIPDPDDDDNSIEEIRLKRIRDVWVILSVDEASEKRIRAEGKRYFYNLRIETHEEEARKMLERISKAELAHSLQNGGKFTDLETLIRSGLLPDDVRTSESTGYAYELKLMDGNMKYYATATPAEYDKSGRLSFLLTIDPKGISRVTSKDLKGKKMQM